jgi:predicted glycosyltransferase
MLAICNHLVDTLPELSIFLISGSPMVHGLKIPSGVDYIKLPCLSRTEEEGYEVKFLGTEIEEMVKLRSDLILSTVRGINPDALLVDKKPFGVKNELRGVFEYMKVHLPNAKRLLLLRDILDKPEATIRVWERNNYYEAVKTFYDMILIAGSPDIFDACEEYQFGPIISEKVKYCGYIRRGSGANHRSAIREKLGLKNEKLVLVTSGGGQDGYYPLETYVAGMDLFPRNGIKSLVICGPEMPAPQRESLYKAAEKYPNLMISEFTNNMIDYMDAADLVVSMGGYNTICEILSLEKAAVVIPRRKPVEEQQIRAERMSRLGYFKTILQEDLNPQGLMTAVMDELGKDGRREKISRPINLKGLPVIAESVAEQLFDCQPGGTSSMAAGDENTGSSFSMGKRC